LHQFLIKGLVPKESEMLDDSSVIVHLKRNPRAENVKKKEGKRLKLLKKTKKNVKKNQKKVLKKMTKTFF